MTEQATFPSAPRTAANEVGSPSPVLAAISMGAVILSKASAAARPSLPLLWPRGHQAVSICTSKCRKC